jgi:hypothetical protein
MHQRRNLAHWGTTLIWWRYLGTMGITQNMIINEDSHTYHYHIIIISYFEWFPYYHIILSDPQISWGHDNDMMGIWGYSHDHSMGYHGDLGKFEDFPLKLAAILRRIPPNIIPRFRRTVRLLSFSGHMIVNYGVSSWVFYGLSFHYGSGGISVKTRILTDIVRNKSIKGKLKSFTNLK